LIKLFELEIYARKASIQMGISYLPVRECTQTGPTVLKAFNIIQMAITAHSLDGNFLLGGEVEADETYLILNYTIKTVRRGSIIYTDRFRSYDSLMFCGYRHFRIDHGKRFSRGKVYLNGLEGFWSYAKERIIKFHGVSKKNSLSI